MISSVSGSGNSYSSVSSSEIARLEKQLVKLLEELKEVVLSDDDEETKKLKTQQLQQQIQMVQNQIIQKRNQEAAEENAKNQKALDNIGLDSDSKKLGVNLAQKEGSLDISI
ncbi:hypothetical protein D3C73_677300 [compost metagenome]